jgi:hypothetical protein
MGWNFIGSCAYGRYKLLWEEALCLGFGSAAGKDHLLPIRGVWVSSMQTHKGAGFTGLPGWGRLGYNKKQAVHSRSYSLRVLAVRGANRGDKAFCW